MTLIISSAEQNPYQNSPDYALIQKNLKKEPGKTYEELIYQRQRNCGERAGAGCCALWTTLTVFPICCMGLKKYKQLWKSTFGGIEQRTVLLECQSSLVALDKPGSKCFEEVDEKEILQLQNFIQETAEDQTKLILEQLAKTGLIPKYKCAIDRAQYYCSHSFKLNASHYGILVLVQLENKVYPRIYYFSNSQGTWRCMPTSLKGQKGEITTIGKGICESDTQAPIGLALALNQCNLHKDIAIPPSDIDIFDIVEEDFSYSEGYEKSVKIKELLQIAPGELLNFHKSGMLFNKAPSPASLRLPEDPFLHPNFNHILQQEAILPEYGKVNIKVVSSYDSSLRYMFIEASDQRAFLARVENGKDNTINIYGLHAEAFNLHGCDAPLLEYFKQIPQPYEPADCSANCYLSVKYVNNWNYVREIPIIKMYYAEQGIPLPPRL